MTAGTERTRPILSVAAGSFPGSDDAPPVPTLSERADTQGSGPVAFPAAPRVADREGEWARRSLEFRRLRSPEAFVVELADGIVDVDLGVAMDAEGRLLSESVQSWKALARAGYSVSKTRDEYSRAAGAVED